MLNIYNQQNNSANASEPTPPLANPASVQPPDFRRYIDPTGEVDTRSLRLGMWYARNKIKLRRLLLAVLAVLSLLFWSFSIWRWADYFIFGIELDQRLQRQSTAFYNYTPIHPRYSPQSLRVVSVEVLAGGTNKYDLVAELSNVDKRFWVEFDYSFAVNGQKTPTRHGFMLAGEQRPVAYLGLESGGYPGEASFALENVRWHRISAHVTSDALAWQSDRLNFEVNNFEFNNRQGGTDSLGANRLRFDLTNSSAYGYREPYFLVALLQGESIVGVLPLRLDSLPSLATRSIDLRQFIDNLSVSGASIYPEINIYDPAVYLAPSR